MSSPALKLRTHFFCLSALGLLAVLASAMMAQTYGKSPPRLDAEVAPSPRAMAAANDTDRSIIREIEDRTQLMLNLEHLCDQIGPRVTGSPQLEKANKWAAEKMKSYGLENVKLEPWEIPVAWQRGTASMKLVEPDTGKSLTIAAMAWTPSTKGKVTGDVVVLDVKTKEDLAKYKGKLKGAIVLRAAPAVVAPVTDLTYGPPAITPKKEEPKKEEPKKDGLAKPEPPKKEEPKKETPQPSPRPGSGEIRAMRQLMGEFLREEGAVAICIDSAKPHGLLTMTGAWQEGDRGNQNEPLPTLFMAHEHYAMLYRLANTPNATRPRVELEVSNTFVPGPITVYNTVGEIRGSEKPDEYVVIGAHLDSWDLGSGATDNGTGSCVVLEVARALSALATKGHKPKRTIRFVLFTGEEQGLFGSKYYVRKHKDELDRISMCLVHDTGTGFVQSIGLQGRESVKKVLEPELAALKDVKGWLGLTTRSSGGTDHLAFEGAGVPGFACQQDIDEYRLTHHTQSDTFDHVKGPNLVQSAQVIAIVAHRVANLPNLLPRDKK